MEKKSNKILVGKNEICRYCGVSVNVWSVLIGHRLPFPARKILGVWRAHADNIDEWWRVATMSPGPQADIPEEYDDHDFQVACGDRLTRNSEF